MTHIKVSIKPIYLLLNTEQISLYSPLKDSDNSCLAHLLKIQIITTNMTMIIIINIVVCLQLRLTRLNGLYRLIGLSRLYRRVYSSIDT